VTAHKGNAKNGHQHDFDASPECQYPLSVGLTIPSWGCTFWTYFMSSPSTWLTISIQKPTGAETFEQSIGISIEH
jgi:hypothetical protein